MTKGNSTETSGKVVVRPDYSQDFGHAPFLHTIAATSGTFSTDLTSISHITSHLPGATESAGIASLCVPVASGDFVRFHTEDKDGANPTTTPTGSIMVFGKVREDGTGPV